MKKLRVTLWSSLRNKKAEIDLKGGKAVKYKNIKFTNLYPSEICLGSELFGSLVDSETSFRIMDMFVDAGGNFIDTAHSYADCYSEEKSISEKTIGKWLRARENRDKMIIATKGGYPVADMPRLSRQEIESDLNESLNFLQVDYIDLYWLHRDDVNRPVGEILHTMNEFVKSGKIRYFGCSNWKADRLLEAIKYAEKNGLKCFVANQMMWSLAIPNLEAISDKGYECKTLVAMNDELKRLHYETGLAAVPYFSQARGFFAKVADGKPEQLSEIGRLLFYSDENLRRLERAKKVSKELGKPVAAIILGYLMAQEITTIPIIGCRKIKYLTEALSATDLELNKDLLAYLES